MDTTRDDLLDELTARLSRDVPGRALVGVDGVDGAGKTVLARAWVERIRATGRWATSVSLDRFHHPRAHRYRQGRTSPTGYLEDSFDLEAFRAGVVEPLRAGRPVRPAAFDHASDRPVHPGPLPVPDGGVVVVDGLFLHRDELAGVWDLSVLLEVPFVTTFARMAVRDGTPADPEHPDNRRYLDGQRLYLDRVRPAGRATVVVENTDPDRPVVRHR